MTTTLTNTDNIIWESVPYCEISEKDLEKYKISENDLLFARTGATVGKSHLVKKVPSDSVYASYLIRVRLKEGYNMQYVAYYLQSAQYWNQITELSAGIGQPNVNGTKLKNLLIALPPIKEQEEIVKQVEQLFTYADTIETQVNNALQRVNQLAQSILHQAFTGKLTAHWRTENPHLITGDNSATALLAQIQTAKQKATSTKKPKKVKNAD